MVFEKHTKLYWLLYLDYDKRVAFWCELCTISISAPAPQVIIMFNSLLSRHISLSAECSDSLFSLFQKNAMLYNIMRAESQAASCQRALNFCITPAIVIYWPRVCPHRGRKSCTTKLSLQIVTRKSQLLFVPIWSRAYCERALSLACYYYFRDCCARLL